jgi:hypothetical protein
MISVGRNNMEQIKRKRLSAMDRNTVYKKFNGHCAYCGKD